MEWIKTTDRLPEKKKGFDHSKQCLVYYLGNEQKTSEYGIAYYHHEPPFKDLGNWVDFARYGRQPDYWQELPLEPESK